MATARNGKKYNTNVIINEGADVCGYMYNGSLSGAYAYGGGLGDANTANTGDVHGTTYIALLGGKVTKDLYAAGTVGSVNNRYNVATDDFDQAFIASTNAYIEGGMARNVYGGGWRGSVGYHAGEIDAATTGDVLGETMVPASSMVFLPSSVTLMAAVRVVLYSAQPTSRSIRALSVIVTSAAYLLQIPPLTTYR